MIALTVKFIPNKINVTGSDDDSKVNLYGSDKFSRRFRKHNNTGAENGRQVLHEYGSGKDSVKDGKKTRRDDKKIVKPPVIKISIPSPSVKKVMRVTSPIGK